MARSMRFRQLCLLIAVVAIQPAFARQTDEDSVSVERRVTNSLLQSSDNTVVGKVDGEFSVTPMGQANYEIPIPAPAGTGGVAPKLSICYNSSTKYGLFGYGFELTGLSVINRAPSNMFNDGVAGYVNFTNADHYSLDGARLCLTSGQSAVREYRTENNTFAKILAYGPVANPDSFVVRTKDGLKYDYMPNTVLLGHPGETALFWMLTRVSDTKGNYFTVSYSPNETVVPSLMDNTLLPMQIDYTGNMLTSLSPYASIRFSYEEDDNSQTTYVYGKRVTRNKHISRIDLYSENTLVRYLQMDYTTVNNKCQLSQITEYAGDGTRKNPTVFEWSSDNNGPSIHTTGWPFFSKAVLTVGDYNGDGRADILATPEDNNSWSDKEWRLFSFFNNRIPILTSSGTFQFDDEVRQVVSGDFNGDGYDDFAVLRFFQYNSSSPTNYTTTIYLASVDGSDVTFVKNRDVYHDTRPYSLQTIEAEGDGMADLFLAFGNSREYKVIRSYDGSPLSRTTTGYSPNGQQWERLEYMDFNGDGLTDIYILYSNTKSLLSADGNGSFSNVTTDLPDASYKTFLGDYNGDGKTDVMVTENNGLPMSLWYIYLSTGTGQFLTNRFTGPVSTLQKQLFVGDINGDGFDDFYAIKTTTGNSNTHIPEFYLNDGTGMFSAHSVGTGSYSLDRYQIVLGDFNGDSKCDIIETIKQTDITLLGYKTFLTSNAPSNLLTGFTDGMGNRTEIVYGNMSDSLVHRRGTDTDYPLTSMGSSWPVVSKVKTPNGIGGLDSTTYRYENALYHRLGRGVIGFEKVMVKDETNNVTTITEYEVSDIKYVTLPKHTETRIGNKLVSESDMTYSPFAYSSQIFAYLPATTVEKTYEYTSGELVSETSTSYEYDMNGNVTSSVSVNGDVTTTTVNTYSDNTSKWHLGRLTESTVAKTNSSMTRTRKARFEYDDSSGLLTSEYTEPDNQQLGFRKTYIHDRFGNIVQSTVRPNDTALQPRTERTTYDAKGRYVTAQINSLGDTVSNTINTATGLLQQTLDGNGFTVSFSYDSFGRPTGTSTPVGQTTTITGWSTGQTDAPSLSHYFVLTEKTGEPAVKEFYDCLGRVIRTVTTDGNSAKVYIDNVYNAKGQLIRTSEPYYSGATVCWNYNDYDSSGRLVAQTDAAGHTTLYSYNGFTTTTTDPLRHRIIRQTDINGNLIRSVDNDGNTIDYQYDVDGHCTQLTGPRTTVRMEYDLMGNRTLLDDPDIGIVSSVYNAFGELVSQTDSKGTTTYAYDQRGRVITEQRPDVTVTTVYDTNYIGAVTSQSASNGTSIAYAYDSNGRIITQTDAISDRTFTTSFTYNQQNKVDTITYPSGFRVKNVYNQEGTHIGVKDIATGQTLWSLDSLNSRGQIVREILGNGLATHTQYDAATGFLTGRTTQGVQNWTYAYNAAGNLVERKDHRRNLTETFEYDGLDLLVKVRQNSSVTQLVSYDAAGNVTSKTGVGHDFVYEQGSNRLLSFYADSPMPELWDNISYTSFSKIAAVSQGNNSLTLTYGPDKSRFRAVTVRNGVSETKYYVGTLYEETMRQGKVRQVCYLFAGGKAFAIRETVTSEGTKMRYLHHDHLGSVQAYTDESGNLVQELSYDAWGARRDPATWTTFDRVADAAAWHERGFCGHEHIDLFEMINMDGRMYDPVVGRFLSPDPFVQAPDYTQGLNRYSYCLNNPLSLIDPSGYSWLSKNWKSLVASAVGIAVSAVTAGAGATLTVAVIAGAAGGAASALVGALLNGANLGQVAKATFTGAFWGGVSAFLNFASADTDLLASLFKHTFSQGWLEGIQGGNMLHGFMMGAVSAGGGKAISKIKPDNRFLIITSTAILSGTVSEIGGGKFANGAITGAFSAMFNDLMHDKKMSQKEMKRRIEEDGKLSFQEAYKWYREGDGSEITVDASSLDLDFIDISTLKIGDNEISTWWPLSEQSFVYGTITIVYNGSPTVTIKPDLYDFDIKPWSLSLGRIARNTATQMADFLHGTGKKFTINFRGTNTIHYNIWKKIGLL